MNPTNSHQSTFFDLEEALARRDEGIARVSTNERTEYRPHFEAAFKRVLDRGQAFTSEEVTVEIPMNVEPHHPNVVGALMRTMVTGAGLVRIGYVQSKRPSRHAGAVALWGSDTR